ncbi:MAG: DUF6198 family protein [Methanoregula sp.]|jgi:uncharacterized membrane protein YczE
MIRVGLLKRYSFLLLGLFFMGLGISLITRSFLGTPPISSIPYVLCLSYPVTFGELTFALSLFFLAGEIVILKKAFPKHQYLQVFVGLFLGVFVDVGMFLTAPVHPVSYVGEIIVLLAGCLVLALGIFLQVSANVIMNPGEGLVKAIAEKTGHRFGIVKIVFDSSLVFGAAIISFFTLGSIEGLREGTVVSALIVGYIILGLGVIFNRLDFEKWLAQ